MSHNKRRMHYRNPIKTTPRTSSRALIMDQNIKLEIDYLKIRRVLKEDETFEYYLKPELRINSLFVYN